MGEHKLRDTLPHLNLYHALNRTLEGRLAYVGPVCSLMQVGACVLARAGVWLSARHVGLGASKAWRTWGPCACSHMCWMCWTRPWPL